MKTPRTRLAALLAILLIAAGCGDESAPLEQAAKAASEPGAASTPENPPQPQAAQDPDPVAPDGKTTALSNAGTWRVTWRAGPGTIPLNEGFSIDVWIEDASDPERKLESISLAVDAAMPDHGHGMNRKPRVTRNTDGSFRVDGMMFHMPGYWELYLDVLRGAIRERAQFAVELE
jgi:hypothetical protein